jgi:hypothetical protein
MSVSGRELRRQLGRTDSHPVSEYAQVFGLDLTIKDFLNNIQLASVDLLLGRRVVTFPASAHNTHTHPSPDTRHISAGHSCKASARAA